MATRPLSRATRSPLADFELDTDALERIAKRAGVEANVARRVLSAYWLSDERETRDLAIVAEVIRRLEIVTRGEQPCGGPDEATADEKPAAVPVRRRMPSVGPRHNGGR